MAASICTALVTMALLSHRSRSPGVERGHDAGGGGVVVAERIADRHDGLADGEIVGIGEFRDFQIARRIVELDHGQIGGGVGADTFAEWTAPLASVT